MNREELIKAIEKILKENCTCRVCLGHETTAIYIVDSIKVDEKKIMDILQTTIYHAEMHDQLDNYVTAICSADVLTIKTPIYHDITCNCYDCREGTTLKARD